VLIEWADRLDVPVTARQLDVLAGEVSRSVEHVEPWRARPAGLSPKGGASAEDARRIAARLEASFTPRPGKRALR
jgi:methylphosphotriester-DNA--protein-cysteine methyltransferase